MSPVVLRKSLGKRQSGRQDVTRGLAPDRQESMGTLRALPTLVPGLPGTHWITRELTPAENRILELVALGLPSREIAGRMSVTRQAVTWHIGNLFMKLGAENRAGL